MLAEILEQNWYSLSDKSTPVKSILSIVLDTKNKFTDSVQMHVGTDAQKIGKRTELVTVICLHDTEIRRGGRVWYTRSKVKKGISLQEKLFRETWLSIEVALGIISLAPDAITNIRVHVDANPQKRDNGDYLFQSGKFVTQLAGMVMAQGFKYILKPDAWAASHAADQIVKYKHVSSRERRQVKKLPRKVKKSGMRRAKRNTKGETTGSAKGAGST